MRTPGDGTITALANGRFWVRSPVQPDGKRKPLGTYATREEAEEALEASLALMATGERSASLCFVTFGRAVLDQREEEGVRGVDKERDRFEFHLAKSAIATMALKDITTPHVADFARALARKWAADKRGARKIKRPTIQRALSIGSVIMLEALDRGLISVNPFGGVKVRKRADEDTEEVWTYLNQEEQRAIVTCEKIPYIDRLIIRIAMGCGVRQGELYHNRISDLHLDDAEPHWFIRFGSKTKVPKNGKMRRCDLFGDALVAMREWMAIRPTFIQRAKGARWVPQPDEGLVFPTITGCRRVTGKPLGNGIVIDGKWIDRFKHYCNLAGVPLRPGLHWHSLRHTCATSLLEGWWAPDGKGAALEEVKEHLGHSSITVTQRYAHHAGTRIRAMAARMNVAALDRFDEHGVRMPRSVEPSEILRYVREREAAGYALVTASAAE